MRTVFVLLNVLLLLAAARAQEPLQQRPSPGAGFKAIVAAAGIDTASDEEAQAVFFTLHDLNSDDRKLNCSLCSVTL